MLPVVPSSILEVSWKPAIIWKFYQSGNGIFKEKKRFKLTKATSTIQERGKWDPELQLLKSAQKFSPLLAVCSMTHHSVTKERSKVATSSNSYPALQNQLLRKSHCLTDSPNQKSFTANVPFSYTNVECFPTYFHSSKMTFSFFIAEGLLTLQNVTPIP